MTTDVDINAGFSGPAPKNAAPLEAVEDLDVDLDAPIEDDFELEDEADATKAVKRPSNRALIRRVATKAEEVISASADTREMVATILGSGTGTGELTTAIMTAGRSAAAPLADIDEISKADPVEGTIAAMTMGKPALKAVWKVLQQVNALSSTPIPASDAKAAKAVVVAIAGLEKDTHKKLDRAVKLMKRS